MIASCAFSSTRGSRHTREGAWTAAEDMSAIGIGINGLEPLLNHVVVDRSEAVIVAKALQKGDQLNLARFDVAKARLTIEDNLGSPVDGRHSAGRGAVRTPLSGPPNRGRGD